MGPSRAFLLSPAYCGGRRAAILLRDQVELPVRNRLRNGSLTLGEAFAFLSGLYFRGKLAYAREFGRPSSPGAKHTLVITPTRGLMPPESLVTADLLREFAAIDLSENEPRYRQPLDRDVAALTASLSPGARVVLLGSVATGKYVDVLAPWLGHRLVYPTSFIGRGDMSRGGLLLRSVASGVELEYEPLHAGQRVRGARPARLERPARSRRAAD